MKQLSIGESPAENDSNNWQDEWVGMPEYKQFSQEAKYKVTVNFLSIEDIETFNTVTGLNITPRTKGVFFPKSEINKIEYR